MREQDTSKKEQVIRCIAFSDRGYELACRIARDLGGEATRSSKKFSPAGGADVSAAPMGVQQWTAQNFHTADALIFVGAAGIAVRAISPHVQDKTTDPAVVVIDERALHVIPLLSGHLGGANDLARRIAVLTGSDCVITTATDVNGVFAVDEWSKQQNCRLLEKEKIMHISGTLLAGRQVSVYSRWPIAGTVPEGIHLMPVGIDPYVTDADGGSDGQDFWDENVETGEFDTSDGSGDGHYGEDFDGDDYEEEIDTNDIDVSLDIEVVGRHPLHLVPQICVLGIGCRRGASEEAIEERLFDVLEMTCVHPAAICAVATIDLKKDEPGLTSFCETHGWPLLTYSAEELQQVKGTFTPSAFVSSITGVDNVCERSAVLASGGALMQKKISGGGVTIAMAVKPYTPDWNWRGVTAK